MSAGSVFVFSVVDISEHSASHARGTVASQLINNTYFGVQHHI